MNKCACGSDRKNGAIYCIKCGIKVNRARTRLAYSNHKHPDKRLEYESDLRQLLIFHGVYDKDTAIRETKEEKIAGLSKSKK